MPKQRSPDVTSRMMAAVKSKNSKAELLLRRALFNRGRRYRIHYPRLTGKPDIVFPRAKLAVFVDGDFWHGNAWRLRGMPSFEEQFRFKSNPEFWEKKIRGNIERDREVTLALATSGWRVLRLWESEVLSDVAACVARVEEKLREAPPVQRAQSSHR